MLRMLGWRVLYFISCTSLSMSTSTDTITVWAAAVLGNGSGDDVLPDDALGMITGVCNSATSVGSLSGLYAPMIERDSVTPYYGATSTLKSLTPDDNFYKGDKTPAQLRAEVSSTGSPKL